MAPLSAARRSSAAVMRFQSTSGMTFPLRCPCVYRATTHPTFTNPRYIYRNRSIRNSAQSGPTRRECHRRPEIRAAAATEPGIGGKPERQSGTWEAVHGAGTIHAVIRILSRWTHRCLRGGGIRREGLHGKGVACGKRPLTPRAHWTQRRRERSCLLTRWSHHHFWERCRYAQVVGRGEWARAAGVCRSGSLISHFSDGRYIVWRSRALWDEKVCVKEATSRRSVPWLY
jgi:hypothetical protein